MYPVLKEECLAHYLSTIPIEFVERPESELKAVA